MQSRGPVPRKPERPHVNLFGYFCDALVKDAQDMPTTPHWAVLLFRRGSELIDDRNDHGAPTSSYVDKDFVEYYAMIDEDDVTHFAKLFHEEKALGRWGPDRYLSMRVLKVAGVAQLETKVSITLKI